MEESNVFAFIGDRGGGKTTALEEFCCLLQEYGGKDEWAEEIAAKETGEGEQYRFYVLPLIDASTLEVKEDLMEVILANMYHVFQERVQFFNERQSRSGQASLIKNIISKFDEVYKDYLNVGNRKEREMFGESVLAKLNSISNSLKTRAALEELIAQLREILCRDRDIKPHLVIIIDDLDLNLENGYEMLEQLHKYFSLPGVVVLTAIKYEQMKMICEKHIIECLVPKYGGVHEGVYEKFEKKAKKQSYDYLLKVLPLSNRIYMPEQFRLHGRDILVFNDNLGKNGYAVKQYLMAKIALKTGVFYDGKGKKKHFCLPNTVRELVEYDNFLDTLFSLNEIEGEQRTAGSKAVDMGKYDQNYDRFNNDIENRMAPRLLDDRQLELYHVIMGIDLERRSKYTVNFLQLKSQNWSVLQDNAEELVYCYSDLLKEIYGFGREDLGNKALVHCIIASFTSAMVREYYNYRNSDNEYVRESAQQRLKSFLGKSFGGKWYDDEFKSVPIYYKGRENRIAVRYDPDTAVNNMVIILRNSLSKTKKSEPDFISEWLLEMIPVLECLMMFFSNNRGDMDQLQPPGWRFSLKSDPVDGDLNPIEIEIRSTALKADFDPFGFIGWEMINDKNIDFVGIRQGIVKAMEIAMKDLFAQKNYVIKEGYFLKFEKDAKNKSIWSEGKRGKKAGAKAFFPYYNLDISYNVMKRVRRKLKTEGKANYQSICEYLRIAYGYIALELKEEDAYYNKVEWTNGLPGYYQDFVDSPFIKAFGIICADQNVKKGENINEELWEGIFYQAIKGLSMNVVQPGEIEQQNVDP